MTTLSVILVLTAVMGAPKDEIYPKSSGVTILDKALFKKKFATTKDVACVQFFQPKSPSFKKSHKDWSTAATELAGLAHFSAIDCAANAEECKEYGVSTFPAYKCVVNGVVSDYKGPVEHKKISEWLGGVLPAVETLKKSGDKKWFRAKAGLAKAILFSKTDRTPLFFRSASAELAQRMAFAEVSNTERKLVRKFKVESYPSLFVIPPSVGVGEEDGDDDDDDLNLIPYTGKFVPAAVMSFLNTHAAEVEEEEEVEEAASSIEQLSDDSCVEALCPGLCAVAVLSHDPSVKSSKRAFREALSTLEQLKAERTDNHISFVWLDGVAEMEFLDKTFAMTPQDYPQLVVIHGKRMRYAPFVGAFSKEGLSSFLKDVQNNKIPTQPMGVSKMPSLAATTKRCASMKTPQGKPKPGASASASSGPRPRGYRGSQWVVDLQDSNYSTIFTPSLSAWVVAVVDQSTPEAFLSSFEEAAKTCKYMVRFGRVRAGAEGEEVTRLLTGEASVQLPQIRLFPAGEKSADTSDLYQGQITSEAIADGALKLLDPGASLVRVIDAQVANSFSEWWTTSPLQPRILLFTDKNEVPKLLKALALEYANELPFGVAPGGESPLSRQFEVKSFPQFAMLQGVPQGQADARGATQVKIQHQMLPQSQLSTLKMIKMVDDVARQWASIKRQMDATGTPEDLKSEL